MVKQTRWQYSMKAGHLLLSVICTDPLTSNVVHGKCAWSDGNNWWTQITEQIKMCKSAHKNRMDLICLPHQCDTCQLRLQHLDGRRHDDNRRQVIPYLNDRKEAVSEGINRPNWNAESAPMSSCALHVWTEVDWCWYRNLSMNYPVHHNGSGLSPAFLQRAPSQLLHHYG